jgi:hypothetical protein
LLTFLRYAFRTVQWRLYVHVVFFPVQSAQMLVMGREREKVCEILSRYRVFLGVHGIVPWYRPKVRKGIIECFDLADKLIVLRERLDGFAILFELIIILEQTT